MGGLAFVNPAMIAGALALAIPLAIHLLTRRTPVLITFPTLRFLMAAKANQSRLFRIRHYVLLLVRSLVILLLLAAFLRPVLTKGTLAATAAPEGGTATVVIVDTSLSMGYAKRGVSPLARGLSAAETTINQLGSGDLANVVYAGAVPQSVFEKPSANRTQLRSDLADRRHTASRADIDAAIALALKQLDAYAGRNREIHFISDFQRTNWAATDFAAIPDSVKTVFVSVADPAPANAAITGIQLRPARPAVGERVELVCRVANHGPEPRPIPVTAFMGNSEVHEAELDVGAGMTATTSFHFQFDASGFYEGTVAIGEDALQEDNTRHVVVQVSERFPVVILSDAPAQARGASHRFLAAALDPFSDRTSVFVPEVMPTDAFDRFAAGRAHAVFLSQAGPMSDTTAALLVRYLEDGGRVVYFTEGPADRTNLELIKSTAGDAIKLPFTPLDYVGDDEGRFATLASANYEEPMLKKFRDTSALADLHFYSYFATRREEAQGQVLLKYDNNHIALARTSFGLGSLLLANFSPRLDGSDIQKSTVFVPLIHEMVKALSLEGGGMRSFFAGYPCSTSVTLPAAGAPVRFTDPAGVSIGAAIDLNGTRGAVFFNDTHKTGIYRIYSAEEKLGAIPVNTDPRESNLESLTPLQLEEMSRRSQEAFYASTGADAGTLRQMREGVPLWQYFLAAALAFLAIEQGMAFLWRR